MMTIARSTTGEWPTGMAVATDGTIFVSTQNGLRVLKKGDYVPVFVPPSLLCALRYSLNRGHDGDLWVTSLCGAAKYSVADIRDIESDSQIAIHPQYFDLYDGAEPSGLGVSMIYRLARTVVFGLLLKVGSASSIRHTFPGTRFPRLFTLRTSLPMVRDMRFKNLCAFLFAHAISKSTTRH